MGVGLLDKRDLAQVVRFDSDVDDLEPAVATAGPPAEHDPAAVPCEPGLHVEPLDVRGQGDRWLALCEQPQVGAPSAGSAPLGHDASAVRGERRAQEHLQGAGACDQSRRGVRLEVVDGDAGVVRAVEDEGELPSRRRPDGPPLAAPGRLRERGLEFRGTDGSESCLTFMDPDGNWFQLAGEG